MKFIGTGTVPAPGAGWRANGNASITGGVIQTTAAVSNQAGSAFFETPLDSRHLVVEFDQTIGSGTGADGQTLTFADASKAAPTALGEKGGGLGFAGISGIAVAFDTWKNSANPSNNFVGISDGSAGAGLLHWLSTATSIPGLRTATRHIKIETLNGTITVWIDGAQALTGTFALPPKVLLGFTGGTGGSNDLHKAANVTVTGDTGPKEEPPKEEPPAASLKITNAISAPSGPPQSRNAAHLLRQLPVRLHDRRDRQRRQSPRRRLTGAVQGASCSVAETAPSGTGWKTTVSVNGAAPVELDRLRRQSHRPHVRARRRHQHRRLHQHLHAAERRTAGGEPEDHERGQRAVRSPAERNAAHLLRQLPVRLHDAPRSATAAQRRRR